MLNFYSMTNAKAMSTICFADRSMVLHATQGGAPSFAPALKQFQQLADFI